MARVDVVRGELTTVARHDDRESPYAKGTKPEGYWELDGQVAGGENYYNTGIYDLDSFSFSSPTFPASCDVTIPLEEELGELDIRHHAGENPNNTARMQETVFQVNVICGPPRQPDAPVVLTDETTSTSITIKMPELPICADILVVQTRVTGTGTWDNNGSYGPATNATIDGLNPAQLYDLRVLAVNNVNAQETPSDPVTELTLCAPPTLTGAFDVILTWNLVDGAATYKVRRNGVEIAEVAGTTYTDHLQSSATNAYTVTAVNANGMESGESNEVNVNLIIIMVPPV